MIPNLWLSLAALAVPSLSPPASDPPRAHTAAADSELRVYELAAFGARVDSGESRPFVPYTHAQWEDPHRGSDSCLDAEHLTDLIGELLGGELEYEDRGLWIDERGRLVVRGPASLQAEVQRTIAFLESALSTALELRVDRIRLDAAHAASMTHDGVVASRVAQELRALSGEGVRRESHVLRVHPGQTARVQRFREHAVVTDFDVEIAQGAAIGDPNVSLIQVGVDLAVRAAPSTGGVLLAILGQFGDAPERPRTRKDASSAYAGGESYSQMLELPKGTQSLDLGVFSLGCNSFLPDGAALVFRVDTRLGGPSAHAITELLVVERTGGELPRLVQHATQGPNPRRLELLNAEVFAPPRCIAIGALVDGQARSGFAHQMRWNAEGNWLGAWLRMGEYDAVAEILSDVGRSGLEFQSDGPWILGQDSAELAEELRAAGIEPTPLESDVARLVEAPLALRLEARLLQAGDARPVVRFVLPVRAGEESVVSVGREWLETFDFDVEVAQRASTPDPQVRVGFEGLFLRARLSTGSAGGIVLDVSGEARLLARAERFDLGSDLLDGIDQSDFDALVVGQRVHLRPDQENGGALLLGDPGQLALELTVAR